MAAGKGAKLDRVFLRRFKRCLLIMFPAFLATSTLLFVLLLGMSFLQQVLYYNAGLISSQFIEVMVDKDHSGFHQVIFTSMIVIICTSLVKGLVSFVSGILYVNWRGSLTRFIHKFYFAHDTYYKLNALQQDIDNLDQRITQDVDKFSNQFSSIFSTLVISPFIVGYYTYQCYKSIGYIGPLSIYGYFIVGTLVNKLLMAPIIKLVFQQEKLEGNFRFKHMQIRVNAESTAFYRSGLLEEKKTNIKLENLLGVQLRLVSYQLVLQCSVNFFDYFGSIVSYLVVSIPLFTGKYDDLMPGELAAVVSKYSFISMYLVHSFSQIIDLSNKISDIAGYTHRIGEVLESLKEETEATQDPFRYGDLDDGILFKIEGLTYSAPQALDKPLVKALDLEIRHGKNLLVTGKTGSGKSSLLRIMCGLWKPDCGRVVTRATDEKYTVLFLPQKPLLTDGSLKQQVIYPEDEDSSLDDLLNVNKDHVVLDSRRAERVLECLQLVKLIDVCDRAGGVDHEVDWNWEDMLSPGEMQRLSFARLFYHKPDCAVLDEASSALDIETENEFYQLCDSYGITLISVGHRESLRQFHHSFLILDGEGGWKHQTLH
ncbi:ATP-binding cassette sub-family D member 4-like [Dendronephthya gigantea]|uniref:ATP-binding cassette sub-family D member 4-like n=1 Tax=Dendronephthya gigantea TaxID=151771 RepID=UPI001069979F|nr:ATP-binding cassette sub-family D member 4-like [Dendronephthya gigantea]